ncbi:hypothetical protein BDW75DRAFT_560 [Aspergillus navahoensis]
MRKATNVTIRTAFRSEWQVTTSKEIEHDRLGWGVVPSPLSSYGIVLVGVSTVICRKPPRYPIPLRVSGPLSALHCIYHLRTPTVARGSDPLGACSGVEGGN